MRQNIKTRFTCKFNYLNN